MIIYGWGHFNRRDHAHTRRKCANCGHAGFFRSYTATRYATLYFLPLLPFGRRRIVGECPQCKMGNSVSQREWDRLAHTELPARLADWRADRGNTEKTRGLLAMAQELEDNETYREVAEDARKRFAQDQDLLLAIAVGYESLLASTDAQSTFLQAAELGGEHADAIWAEAEFSTRRSSERPPDPPNRWLQSASVAIVPTVVAVAVLWVVGALFVAGPKHVYAVNGLDAPYFVQAGGKPVELPPQTAVRLRVPYGNLRVEPVAGGFAFDPITAELDIPRRDRLFSKTVFVVNPDAAAFLVRSSLAYAAIEWIADEKTSFEPVLGERFYRFDGIDDPFTRAPDEVKLPYAEAVVYRNGLFVESGDPAGMAHWLFVTERLPAALAFLRTWINLRPARADLLHLYLSLEDKETGLAFVRERLPREGHRIEWHRAYQRQADGLVPYPDLLREYDGFLAAEPANAAWHYLRGRLCRDRAETQIYLGRALELDPECAFSNYGMAWHALVGGDFEAARSRMQTVLRLAPDNPLFESVARTTEIALGNWGREIGAFTAHGVDPLDAHDSIFPLVHALAASGETARARSLARQYAIRHSHEFEENEAILHAPLLIAIAKGEQDREALPDLLAGMDGSFAAYQTALLRGDLSAAWASWGEGASQHGDPLPVLLFLAAMARERGDAAVAGAAARTIATHLENGTESDRWIAGLVARATPPSLDEILAAPYMPSEMRLLLYAAGIAHPAQRETFFAHARRLNFDRDTYKMVLEALL